MVNIELSELGFVDAHLVFLLHVDEPLLYFVPSHVGEFGAGNLKSLSVEGPNLQVEMKMIENFDEAESPESSRDD